MSNKQLKNRVFILVTAFLLGLFIVMQSQSFDKVNDFFSRDNQSNVFQEIMIIKNTNEDLKKEVDELEERKALLTDQNLALDTIEAEIEKYEKLTGDFNVFGPGITVNIDDDISTAWLVDLHNEFLNVGAEAVSINGIRLTNQTIGFDTLPRGQILLNGSILSPPYIFNVIGEPEVLSDVPELPGGIFSRLAAAYPDVKIEAVKKEIVQMQ